MGVREREKKEIYEYNVYYDNLENHVTNTNLYYVGSRHVYVHIKYIYIWRMVVIV